MYPQTLNVVFKPINPFFSCKQQVWGGGGGGGGIYAVKTGSNRKWMKLFMKRAFSTSASTTFVPDCSFGQNWNMFANTVDTVETTELRWRQLYW